MKKLIVFGCGGEKSEWKDSPQKKLSRLRGRESLAKPLDSKSSVSASEKLLHQF